MNTTQQHKSTTAMNNQDTFRNLLLISKIRKNIYKLKKENNMIDI